MSSASKPLGAVLKGNVNIRIQLRAALTKGVCFQGCIEEGGVWSVQSCLHTDPWLCVLCCISAAWIVIRIGELLECMAKTW